MNQTELLADGLMTLTEAQEYTRLSRSDLYARMTSGTLPYVKLGRRRMIPRRALVEMVGAGLVGATEVGAVHAAVNELAGLR